MKQQELGMSSNSLPLVTIGIPTYNRPHFLKESLASALNQSYQNIEVVVSDNSENDDSRKVVEEIGDPRVKYSRNERNMGAAYNWMRCMEMASGEYFGWLQDDDLLLPEFVSRGVTTLNNDKNIASYYSYAVLATSPDYFCSTHITGSPFAFDWRSGKGYIINKELVPIVSIFHSVGWLPACMFRKKSLLNLELSGDMEKGFNLFFENIIFIMVAQEGNSFVNPVIDAVCRLHNNRTSHTAFDIYEKHYKAYIQYLNERITFTSKHLDYLRDWIADMPESFLLSQSQKVPHWPNTDLMTRISHCMKEEFVRRGIAWPHDQQSWLRISKSLLRNFLPPILVKLARSALSVIFNKGL